MPKTTRRIRSITCQSFPLNMEISVLHISLFACFSFLLVVSYCLSPVSMESNHNQASINALTDELDYEISTSGTTLNAQGGINQDGQSRNSESRPPSTWSDEDYPARFHNKIIPVYTVDLSVAPEHRYDHVVADFKKEIASLPMIYDHILSLIPVPKRLQGFTSRLLRLVSRALLRRIHDDEQMLELKGIARASGVEIYLLVALNVLLDLFMGCTSGGALVQDSNEDGMAGSKKDRMVHLRVLDWTMSPLRDVVVELRFVAKEGGPVIATNVTYLGFVGILTGVR